MLFAAGDNRIFVYTPTGSPDPSWAPVITSCPGTVESGHSYVLEGRQLNGLSQAVSYGDDVSSATNYPLVRIRHLTSGKTYFCRTFNHSSMGVATGSSIQSTNFAVPFGVPLGSSELVVIANGIASAACGVNVLPFRWWIFPNYAEFNRLIGSLADGPLWVLGPHGPVPVDPWGPLVADRANRAYSELRSAIQQLYELGDEVIQLREKASGEAQRLPVAKADKAKSNKAVAK